MSIYTLIFYAKLVGSFILIWRVHRYVTAPIFNNSVIWHKLIFSKKAVQYRQFKTITRCYLLIFLPKWTFCLTSLTNLLLNMFGVVSRKYFLKVLREILKKSFLSLLVVSKDWTFFFSWTSRTCGWKTSVLKLRTNCVSLKDDTWSAASLIISWLIDSWATKKI